MSVIRRDDGPTEREEAAIREGMAFAQAAEDAREERDEARADLVIARQRLAGAVAENARLKRVVSRIPQAQLIRTILDIEAEDAASPPAGQ